MKNKSIEYVRKALGLSEDEELHLEHWLRVLGVFGTIKISGSGTRLLVEVYDAPHFEGSNYKEIVFNLTTGQPASEADYKAFNEIVSPRSN